MPRTHLLQIFAPTLILIIGCGRIAGFSPEVEEQLRADYAIKRYLYETYPLWTCEYTAEWLPREGTFVVRRVVLAGKEKCSKSHRSIIFDVLYDPKRDTIVQIRYPDLSLLSPDGI
jgi:hypothetical protein